MLDSRTAIKLIDSIWAISASQVVLPEEWTDFFVLRGRAPCTFENRRRHARYYLRGRAVIEKNEIFYPVLTRDLSRTGIGILTGKQHFPMDNFRLYFSTGKCLELSVVRCRRIQSKCYECGTRFENASLLTAESKLEMVKC